MEIKLENVFLEEEIFKRNSTLEKVKLENDLKVEISIDPDTKLVVPKGNAIVRFQLRDFDLKFEFLIGYRVDYEIILDKNEKIDNNKVVLELGNGIAEKIRVRLKGLTEEGGINDKTLGAYLEAGEFNFTEKTT